MFLCSSLEELKISDQYIAEGASSRNSAGNCTRRRQFYITGMMFESSRHFHENFRIHEGLYVKFPRNIDQLKNTDALEIELKMHICIGV